MMYQRGDIVVCVLSGDYGKPCPAVVVQSDLFNPTHASITVCPITSHIEDASLFRLSIEPSAENGLRSSSQIMIDKISTLKREKVHQRIGKLSEKQIEVLNTAIKQWLDL
jgi:mRNA interferase MazF